MGTDRIKFYADVHIARAIAEALQREGADFVLACDRGRHNADDEAHLTQAHKEGRVVVTQDEDFLNLHQHGAEHSGIVYFPQGAGIGYMVKQLVLLYAVCTAAEMRGRVEFL